MNGLLQLSIFSCRMSLSDPTKLMRAMLNDEVLEPTVFHEFINHWKAREWSPEYLANHDSLTRKELIFRVAETADREPANKCTRHCKSQYIFS